MVISTVASRANVTLSSDIVGHLAYGGAKALFDHVVNNDGDILNKEGDVLGQAKRWGPEERPKAVSPMTTRTKGSVQGHAALVNDISVPDLETEEYEGNKQKHPRIEQDPEIAKRICVCVEYSFDESCPIRKMITENIDRVERQPEEERNEEDLIETIEPLIEGGKVLAKANGVIHSLDPDDRIAGVHGTVIKAIEIAKRKLKDMQSAKTALDSPWGLLA
ncbi:uncharacterized protein PG998_014797 [Apiospora kogelbergensis]|uniref:uncharacterized protein n=1 Tax=Apiospora kogelbergensis TaxID=1337665 RepID=UPI003131ADE4